MNEEFLKQQADMHDGIDAIEDLFDILNELKVTDQTFYQTMDIWPDHQEFCYKTYKERIERRAATKVLNKKTSESTNTARY